MTVGGGIANTAADLVVTIIPIPLIARLELPRRRRIGAFIFVGTGFLICAAGAARAFYTWRSLVSSYDQTWESYGMFMSAAIEIDLGVVRSFAEEKTVHRSDANVETFRFAPVYPRSVSFW